MPRTPGLHVPLGSLRLSPRIPRSRPDSPGDGGRAEVWRLDGSRWTWPAVRRTVDLSWVSWSLDPVKSLVKVGRGCAGCASDCLSVTTRQFLGPVSLKSCPSLMARFIVRELYTFLEV